MHRRTFRTKQRRREWAGERRCDRTEEGGGEER